MMKFILVTGGTGFIGSHICEELLKRNNNVICLDNLSTGKKSNIIHLLKNKKFKFINRDIGTISKNKLKFSTIYHFASCCGVERVEEHPNLILKDLENMYKLLKYCTSIKIKKFIFSSSSEVYGNHTNQKEDGILSINNLYSKVKLHCEFLLERCNFKTLAIRYFNIYGERQRKDFVVSKFIELARNKKPLVIIGNGKQTRDFTYIKDVVNATLKLTDECEGIINLGTGKETSISRLAELINSLMGNKGISYVKARDEIKKRCANTEKLKKYCKLEYDLKQGMSELCKND